MNHIHVVNQGIEKSAEFSKPLYIAFVDYEKAFDSVNTAAVIDALKYQGIEETYIKLRDDMYKVRTGRIILRKKNEKLPIRKGERQGDTISPKLFTAYLEGISKKLDWGNAGLRINGEYLSNSRFADDIGLLGKPA